MTTEINHPVIGPVTVCKSRRARRISISVRPPDRVRLSIPYGVSVGDAMAFLGSRAQWIEEAKRKVAAKVKPEPVIGMPYRTRGHELALDPAPTDKIQVTVQGGRIHVKYPIDQPYTSEPVQQAIKRGIETAWRIEAAEVLPGRVAALAAQHGFKYRSVTVRNTRSRWGSCSARDDLSLSIRLMQLPDQLIDYIVLHELCHTVQKNHGPKFHALLDRVTGGRHAQLRRQIKGYKP